MKTMTAAAFKAQCLKVMDEVQLSRGEVVITKRGKPVAKLVPFVKPKRKSIFGCLRHIATLDPDADIVSPSTPPEAWEND